MKQLVLVVFLAFLTLCAIVKGIANYLASPTFGSASIALRDGSKLYVVHERWGLHSDELSVTQNRDGCLPPNPDTDYIDTYGDGHTLVYAETNEGLVLYDEQNQPQGVTIHIPTRPWSNVRVTVKQGPLSAMIKNPDLYGVRVLSVPASNRCWKNIFRTVDTSLRSGR